MVDGCSEKNVQTICCFPIPLPVLSVYGRLGYRLQASVYMVFYDNLALEEYRKPIKTNFENLKVSLRFDVVDLKYVVSSSLN